MQIVIHNLLAGYSKSGSGPVIVLLHGWGDSSATFKSLESSLQDRFTLLNIDLPGFGSTDRPHRPFTLADYVDFVASLLKKTDCEDVYAFIGHSNGGSIAIRGLSTQKFSSPHLVLLASAGIRSRNTFKQKFYKVIAKIVKFPLYMLPKKSRDSVRKKMYSFIGSDLFVAEGMHDTFRNVVSEDLLKTAGSIRSRTLLLYGENDKATPPLFGDMYAQVIKDSDYRVIPGVGHFLHHENPEQVNKIIKEFLAV